MKKGFVSNIIFLIGLNLVVKPIWIFGVDRHVQNHLGEEIYGSYFSLLGFTYLFNILLDFGLQYYNSRNIAAYPNLKEKYFSHFINLKFILAGAYFLITILAAFALGYNKSDSTILIWLMLNQFMVSMLFFLRSNLSGSLKFVQDSFISVLDKALMIVFCLALIRLDLGDEGFNLFQFIYAQTAAYIFALFVAVRLVGNLNIKYKFSFKFKYYQLLVRRTIPYAIAVFLMTLYGRLDAVMIERLLGDKGDFYAGVYAQSFRIMDAANMIGLLMAGILLPVFARMLKDSSRLGRLAGIAFNLIMVISFPLGGSMIFFNTEIIELLYVNPTVESAQILFYLGITHILISAIYITGTLLTAAEHLKSLNVLFTLGVIGNFVLNLYLINDRMALGAAQATVLTQAMILLGQFFFILKFRLINLHFFNSVRFTIYMILMLSFFSGMQPNGMNIFLKLFLAAALSLILTFLLNLLNKSSFRELLPN